METFPWEVGDPPDDSGGVAEFEARLVQGSLVAGSTLTSTVAIGRSVLRQMISIGGGHGWKIELPDITEGDARTRPPGLGSQVDLGLTDITKYPSYSKLWRMLYFVNDAPFCIHTHGWSTARGETFGVAMPSLPETDLGKTWIDSLTLQLVHFRGIVHR